MINCRIGDMTKGTTRIIKPKSSTKNINNIDNTGKKSSEIEVSKNLDCDCKKPRKRAIQATNIKDGKRKSRNFNVSEFCSAVKPGTI